MRLERLLPLLGDSQKVVLVDDETCDELAVYDGRESLPPFFNHAMVEQIIGNSEGVRIYIYAPKSSYRRKGE